MYYVVDKHMCFVCYQVADMPTPRVSSVRQPCAVATRRFGYRRNRLPHRPKFVFAAQVSTDIVRSLLQLQRLPKPPDSL